MFENLRLLYHEYGGIPAALRSGYFWCAIIGTVISVHGGAYSDWTSVTTSVMPSITGFTIAAFALVFAVLGPEQIKRLSPRGPDGKSPLLGIMSSIAHAVVIQATSLIFASIIKLSSWTDTMLSNWVSNFPCLQSTVNYVPFVFASLGIFLTLYGLLLVLASVLSIFRMSSIIWR